MTNSNFRTLIDFIKSVSKYLTIMHFKTVYKKDLHTYSCLCLFTNLKKLFMLLHTMKLYKLMILSILSFCF